MRRVIGGLLLGMLASAPSVATASTISLGFSNVGGPHLLFSNGALTFTDRTGDGDIQATDDASVLGRGVGSGNLGNNGVFSIGVIHGVDFGRGLQEQSGSVTGADGSFSITDGVNSLSEDLDWVRVFTVGSAGSTQGLSVGSEDHRPDGQPATVSSQPTTATAPRVAAAAPGPRADDGQGAYNASFLTSGPMGMNLSFNFGTKNSLDDLESGIGGLSAYAGTLTSNPVPEPASLLFLGTGLLGLARSVRRRRRAKNQVRMGVLR